MRVEQFLQLRLWEQMVVQRALAVVMHLVDHRVLVRLE
jgi:hypothetical protein